MRRAWQMRMRDRKGVLLITSYFLMAILLIYSNLMVMRSTSQRLANDQLRNRIQNTNLAQAAVESLREELYQFLTSDIYEDTYNSDPRRALAWLDSLDQATLPAGMRAFDPNHDGIRDGMLDCPLCIASLATVQGATTTTTENVCSTVGSGKSTVTTCHDVQVTHPAECTATVPLPHAWVTNVEDLGEDANGNGLLDPGEDLNKNNVLDKPDPDAPHFDFYPRRVTIQARATVNDVTRWVEASYIFSLNASSVFRYGYFMNNFGWLDPKARTWSINGDVRSNGDLTFGATAPANLSLQGDAYASANPELVNPLTLLPAGGAIAGATGYIDDPEDYFQQKSVAGRPSRLLSLPSTDTEKRPPINALYGWWVPVGWGWDTLGADGYAPHHFPAQKAHDLPYLGDLELYKQRAQAENSSLRGRNQYGQLQTISQVYGGPDGNVSTVADNAAPLVLIGTAASPIVIDGPVVVPGDVVIRGVVRGHGTIYAGRNIHIVGQLTYQDPWSMPRLQRNLSTGKLVVHAGDLKANDTWNGWVGTVCDDGRYVAPGGTVPANCIAPNQASAFIPYGYGFPGYGAMGFQNVPEFTARYKTPGAADSLGLSAKGNIIVGDYTSAGFQNKVKPKLESIGQAYVIDASDQAIGYRDYDSAAGAPMFNGNYDRQDWEVDPQTGQLVQGSKSDGTPRKFYESSLANTTLHQTAGVWQPIVDPDDPLYSNQTKAQIDAVLYANHLVAGFVPYKGNHPLEVNGTIIARDDGLVINSDFTLNHDNRLNMGDPSSNGSAWLPVTISRPVLSHWRECPTASCN